MVDFDAKKFVIDQDTPNTSFKLLTTLAECLGKCGLKLEAAANQIVLMDEEGLRVVVVFEHNFGSTWNLNLEVSPSISSMLPQMRYSSATIEEMAKQMCKDFGSLKRSLRLLSDAEKHLLNMMSKR